MPLDEFVGVVETLKERISSHRDVLSANEYRTRVSLIDPLLCALGWDTADPESVMLEYEPDTVIESDDQVDYALIQQGLPIVLVEAKRGSRNLDNRKYFTQLFEYFGKTPSAEIGILTNGIEYRCYSDRQNQNVMDSKPFFNVDITSLSPRDVEILESFSRNKYDLEEAIRLSEQKKEELKKSLIENRESDPIREREVPMSGTWKTLEDYHDDRQNNALKKETPTAVRFPDETVQRLSSWKTLTLAVGGWLINKGFLHRGNCTVPATKSGFLIANHEPLHSNGTAFKNPHELADGIFIPVQGSKRTGIPSQMLRVSWGLMNHCGQDSSQVLLKTG